MVLGPVIRYLLVSVVYPIVIPLMTKYTQVFVMRVKHGISSGSLKKEFEKMYEEVAMKTGYKYPPMTPYEAKKILNLDRTNIDYEAKVILDKFYNLYIKNDPLKGGSIYLQAKLVSAKECLLEKTPNLQKIEEEYIKEYGLDKQRELGEDKESDKDSDKKK